MLDSDDSDFYIGEHQIIDQNDQTSENRITHPNIDSFEIDEGHQCINTEIDVNVQKNMLVECKLVKIVNLRGHPNFHFEINGEMYFYGFQGIKADDKIVLYCTKKLCRSQSSISASEFLKQIFQNSPKNSKYTKKIDRSDPRVYDIENYDINSFDIGKGHKCQGLGIENYLKSTTCDRPEKRAEKVKCKLIKISYRRGHPTFHFEIDGQIYFFGFRGIKADSKIVLCCRKVFLKSKCMNFSYIKPSEFLKQLIKKSPKKNEYPKYLDKSDPRVYDINNYDINSFESTGDHKHPGTKLDHYYKNIFSKENENFTSVIKTENNSSNEICESMKCPQIGIDEYNTITTPQLKIFEKVNCKLLKIAIRRGHPSFHFEINGKMYFYRIRCVKADYTIVLQCLTRKCNHSFDILPLDNLKEIIQDTPKYSQFSKCLDKSDPRVYEINNYDINKIETVGDHTHPGTELEN